MIYTIYNYFYNRFFNKQDYYSSDTHNIKVEVIKNRNELNV